MILDEGRDFFSSIFPVPAIEPMHMSSTQHGGMEPKKEESVCYPSSPSFTDGPSIKSHVFGPDSLEK